MKSSEIEINENHLIDLKESLLNRINLLERNKKRIPTPLPESLDDQAVANENDEVVDKLDELDKVELQSVNDALKRIEQGIFGICTSCGNEIKNKRLTAVPYVENCIKCEKNKLP